LEAGAGSVQEGSRVARWKVLVIGDAQTAKGAPFFKHNHPAW
jgi:hypothetical protein